MTRGKFVEEYTRFIQNAIRLAEASKKYGMIPTIESNVWDLDESIFKDGLILIMDEAYPATINEILSNKIAHEKDKYMCLFKTVQKRAVLGIQAGEEVRILYKALFSIAGLSSNEEHKIELLILSDNEDETAKQEENSQSESESSPFSAQILSQDDNTMKTIVKEFDSDVLAHALIPATKKVREKFYKHMSKRQASMMEEDIEYIGTSNRSEEAQQKILVFLEKITKPHKT
jgi:hypothetical protein